MIQSLIIYLSVAFFMYLFTKDYVYSQKTILLKEHITPKFWRWQLTVSVTIFALICGVRYNVGVDNLMYINFYTTYQNSGILLRGDIEPLFRLSITTFADCGLHYSIWQAFWAAVQITFVYLAVKDNRYIIPYLSLFIILGPTFLSWTNGVRQCVVICIFMYAVKFIVNKELLKFLLWIMICALIHKSAIILLPVYYLFQWSRLPNNAFLLLGCVVGCTVIGNVPSWIGVMNNIDQMLSFLSYDQYADRLNDITSDRNLDSIAWGPSRLGLWLLDCVLIIIYTKLNKQIKFSKIIQVYFFAFFIGTCLFNLFVNTSHIFLRPVAYLRDFRLLIVPICLYYLSEMRRQIPFIILSCLAYFYTIYVTLKAFTSGGLKQNAPEVYKFFFLQ